MSAAEFQRLLAEFRAGWAELEGGHFNLEIRVPGSSSSWEPAYDSDEFELVTHVCLPFRDCHASVDDFTHEGYAVIQKFPPTSATKKGKHRAKWAKEHKRCMAAIQTFKRLSGEAGAAIPNVIREPLIGYCPWQCSSPACQWIALLARVCGITAYNAAGVYQVSHGIPQPWLISIEMIERLGLNTDTPGWERNQPPVGERDGKRRGRKKADYDTEQHETQLAADWERARESGVYKGDFVKEKMTKKEFDKLLDRVAARKKRSDK